MLVAPLPFAAAVAQPWWDENARRTEWERRRREQAQLEWEREHGPYRR